MSVQATGGTESTIEIGGVTYKLHVYTSGGTLDVTVGGDIDYLIVGGGAGGGGAGSSTAGGGGAGGRRVGTLPVSADSYPVVVGAGGASVSGSSNNGNPGQDSSAFGLTAVGGGYGSRFANSGGDGGSGGGGGADSGSGRPGGAGTAGQGNDGGDGAAGGSNSNSAGGGGGGAGAAGAAGVASTAAGDGGVGVDLSGTFGTDVGDDGWFAGGGGGSGHNATAGAGGQGGGGAGGQSGAGTAGTDGTGGGGGGGASNSPSGKGGDGIVIFRYEVSDAMGIAAETDLALAVGIDGGIQQQALTTSALGVVSELWMGHFTSNSLRASAVVTGSPTAVRLVASETDSFTQGWVGAADVPGSYNLVKLDITTLVPGTKYYIALEVDGTVDTTTVGEMTTPGSSLNFQFGSASCSRFHSRVVYNHIHGNNPDMMFFMHTGDLHYADITVNDEDDYQAAFSDVFSNTNPRGLFEALPIPYIWDDHDYSDNNSGSEAASRPAALAAFRRRVPTPDLAAPGVTVDDGVYYTFKVGRIRFIVTDLRSQRSNKSEVSEGPDRTMMGGQQKTWFYEVLEDPANEDDFFCWVNTVPWIGTASSSGDFWNGYATEREELATFFRDSGVWRRLFIISGDMHALTHDDGTNSDYADGGGAPLWVFQCAPIAQSNSIKGGPYSAPVIQENSLYGVFDVVDAGGQSITVNFSGRYVSESSNSETEVQTASMTLTVPRRVSVGLAGDTSETFGVMHSAASLVEMAEETNAALAVTNAKRAHVDLAVETNAALATTRGKRIAIGLASETDTAESVAPVGPNVVLVSRATSASTAFAVSGFKRAFVGLATEIDVGLEVRPVNLIPVGLATSAETASITTQPSKVRILALAEERSQAFALSSGLAPFWWVFHDQTTPGRRPSRQKHRPVVFTDRDDATTYVIVRNSSSLLELREIQPTRHEEVYAPFHEPVMMAGGRHIRVYVEEGELLFEEYPHRVRSRPILFGDKERTRSRDKRYILTLPDDAV